MIKEIRVAGMHCASCEKLLTISVGEVAGAKMLKIDHKTGMAVVEIKDAATLAKVKKAIETEGYKTA